MFLLFRELQYRVEVQNRVYRREMAKLELQLTRLEKKLLSGQDIGDESHTSSSGSVPQRNTSISGGLPLLLLSVLPPVIPRASWPSANPSGNIFIHQNLILNQQKKKTKIFSFIILLSLYQLSLADDYPEHYY